ncbi:MAG: alpha/beta hydrolase [Anaerotruncus colihominis]|nr:alpha/beta hydrolase [Anaerotruncus colihominis]
MPKNFSRLRREQRDRFRRFYRLRPGRARLGAQVARATERMVNLPIRKLRRAALRALSSPAFDIRKMYKAVRSVQTAAGRPPRLFYKPWDHIVRVDGRRVPVRLFAPKTNSRDSILLFFHGGGWVTGNIDSYDRVCANLSNITGRMVVSVDYRLAPEHRFPAAPEDCYAVARDIFTDLSLFMMTPRQITLIGDSAGANLAAAVSLMARDRGEFLPESQILIYPATAADHGPNSPFPSVHENGEGYLLTAKHIEEYMSLYISSEQDRCNPYFAPLEASDLSRQPQTLILTAQYDPLRDEGEAYGERLKLAGNRVEMHRIPDALHGFFSRSPRTQAARQAYGYINRFLCEVTHT